jgi:hypothetical protein
MGPFQMDRRDASDLDAATAASRVAECVVGLLLGFGLGQGCSHRNLLQLVVSGRSGHGPALPAGNRATRATQRGLAQRFSSGEDGRRVAPSRLKVKDRPIEAARAPTRHEARGAPEDACRFHESASPRHPGCRQPA